MSRWSFPRRCSAATPSTSCRSADVRRSIDTEIACASPDVLHEVDALHELHREEAPRVLDDELVEADDVRMRHTGEASELLFQPVNAGWRGVTQGLERDDFVAGAILNLVDHSHSARAQTSEHGKTIGAGKSSSASVGGGRSSSGSFQERARLLVGVQQALQFGVKRGIVPHTPDPDSSGARTDPSATLRRTSPAAAGSGRRPIHWPGSWRLQHAEVNNGNGPVYSEAALRRQPHVTCPSLPRAMSRRCSESCAVEMKRREMSW